MIVLENGELKPQDAITLTDFMIIKEPNIPDDKKTTQNNYLILKDDKVTTRKPINFNSVSNFEDMLYFVCNLCPFLCTKNSKITEHVENAHKNKTIRKLPNLKCPACVNVFFHKMSLRSHLIHDHGVGNSDLSQIVQAVVYYANKAKNDEKNKVKPALNNTTASNTNKKNENPPVVPSVNVVTEPNKTADLPKVVFNQKKAEKIFSLIKQEQDSKLRKTHKCSLCKVTLQSSDNMSYHINCHKDNKFICLVCSQMFPAWKNLSSHLWRMHKIDMELYSCDMCEYKSVSLSKLNNTHKPIHSDVRSFICGICKKGFKNSKQLGNHKMTHKSDYERLKYACEVCSKVFSDKRQLRIHMGVVHEKLRPFLCNYCGYKASSKSSLKMHIRQHTGKS